MSGSAGTYDPKQEIRFAVVMYGGVSLAIYINGVAQELLRMVRATADLPAGQDLCGSELIYRELGQRLAPGRDPGQPLPAAAPDGKVLSRFVVDIISGSSAGGINGVALAKALALRLPNLDGLKEVWLREGTLETLLNDEISEPGKYPPHPDGKTASLINSERMYGMVLETLSGMNAEAAADNDGRPFADEIDLFVTATDLAGLPAPIQLTGSRISERIHKTVFHFEYMAPKIAGGANSPVANHFRRDFDPMLAFAARCTSSFPVAFEPMTFERMAFQLERQRAGLDVKGAETRYLQFFPAYLAQEEGFTKRLFADGGYLDNRPFSYVTSLIPYRASNRPVQRKLLFIDPFPESPTEHANDNPREIGFIENATLAATTLPRYEVIRGDIQAVNEMNRQLDRLAALRDRMDRDAKRLEPRRRVESPADFEASDLEQMVVAYGYGDKYPPYHHLRVYDVSDALGRLLTHATGFEVDSDDHYFVRMLVRSWREAKFSAYHDKKKGKATENSFLTRYDVDYRLRRLNHLRSWIDEKLSPQPDISEESAPLDPATLEDLANFRDLIELQLTRLRQRIREAQSRIDSPLLPILAELKPSVSRGYGEVMSEVERKRRYKAADALYESMKPKIDALMDAVDHHFAETFLTNSKEIQAAFLADPVTSARAELKYIYDTFHWHDLMTLPVLSGTRAREHAEVQIFRVSPADGSLFPGGVDDRSKKLAGTKAGAFAGFAHKEWRENDMMWGRLDGAERIITALLPDPLDKALRDQYLQRVFAKILADEFSAENGGQERVLRCFAQWLRKSETTELSLDELISRGKDILAAAPSLRGVVDEGEFVTFVKEWYRVPPPPPRTTLFGWSARAFKILGRMIDDLPNDNKLGLNGRISGSLRSSGVLMTHLLRFATPASLGRHIARHWLALIALAGLLLTLVGPPLGIPGITYVGLAVIFGCFAGWVVQRLFGRYLSGKNIWKDFAVFPLALFGLTLLVLGGLKLIDMIDSLLRALT